MLVISQVPPPVHGSTVVTKRLLGVLAADRPVVLVDRRFSRSIDEVGRASARKPLAALALVGRLASALARRRPRSAIVFVTNRPGSFLVDLVLCTVIRAAGVPIVHYVHTTGFRRLAERGRGWRCAVALLLGSAARVVVLGPTLVEDIAPWVDRDRVRIVPNASDSKREAQRSAGGEASLLFLSNLLPAKGAHLALETLVRLRDSGMRDVRLVLAGAEADPGYAAELRVRTAEAGVGDRVVFAGAVDPETRDRLLEEAALLLFPSTYPFEAQPLTIVEAMAAGLPVVAFDVGGVADIVHDGRTGTLIGLGDDDALVAATRSLLTDEEQRGALAAGARQEHGRAHSPEAFAAAWRLVLDELEDEGT